MPPKHEAAYCWETDTVEPYLMVRACLPNGQFPFAKTALMGRMAECPDGWHCPPNTPKKQWKDQGPNFQNFCENFLGKI